MFNIFKKKGSLKMDDDLKEATRLGLITEGEQLKLQFERSEKRLKEYEAGKEKKPKRLRGRPAREK